MSKKFTQDYLESLTRREVQALAKEHEIRANLSTKIIINNLLALSPATEASEPKEPPAKVKAKANKRKRDDAEESSQAKKTPANASKENPPAPQSKRRRPTPEPNKHSKAVAPSVLPADEGDEETHPGNIIEQLELHADKNGIQREQLKDIYHVLAGMQKNLCERQPQLMHHVTVRFAVEQMLIVPMKKDRTLVDGSAFLPRSAAREWKTWHQENIIYPEFLHPTNKLPERESDAEEEEAEAVSDEE